MRLEPPPARPRVVIVGAGFGGLSAGRALAGQEVDVLILDRNNYHGFWPLLYQVATAGLEAESIAYPVRAILRKHRNISFEMVEVRGIDFEHKQVLTDSTPIDYDYLVLAAGSANNYFGNDALADRTYGLKDLDDAERLRNRILSAFERAVREPDPARRAALLTLVIVGGGPTGVELAGAFAELIRHVLRKDYPMLDVSRARVLLVEASDRILASFPASLQRSARRRLERMGVEVKLNTAVTSVDDDLVVFKDGTRLEAGTVVWAAGVRAAPLADVLDVPRGRNAQVSVEPTLNLPDRPEVFVIGDMAYLEGYHGNRAYPMVAPVAIQQGRQAARNIIAQLRGRPMRPFRYFDRGQMATIGRRAAVLDAFGVRLSGFIAWLGWLFIHLIELIGFRNRLIVLANWAYNYFTYDRGVRLIRGKDQG
ncbi:MAG TPA: NAD(P)/FAD-dependent oxidoreductase [Roseiflexaceae bacterium]